jgi:putative DNA primase/helicase
MLEWALAYAKAGRAVLPLHTPNAEGKCSCRKANCASVGKHPRTMNGVKDATTSEETIRRWWSMWPDANIGIATGETSGIDCLDVDPRAGGDVALTELIEKHGELPKTSTIRTGGGGYHLLFTHVGIQFKNSASDIGEGLDVKTTGGYIVAAPSLHVSGERYVWIDTTAPTDWPGGLLEELTKPKPKRGGNGSGKLKAFVFTAEGPPITEGKRNKKLFRICSRMRGEGMNQEQIEQAALEINDTRCQPPMEEEEVLGIAASVLRYDPNPVGESEVAA